MELQKLWNMVNNAETRKQIDEAEEAIKQSNIDNDDYDELMNALAYISRENYKRR